MDYTSQNLGENFTKTQIQIPKSKSKKLNPRNACTFLYTMSQWQPYKLSIYTSINLLSLIKFYMHKTKTDDMYMLIKSDENGIIGNDLPDLYWISNVLLIFHLTIIPLVLGVIYSYSMKQKIYKMSTLLRQPIVAHDFYINVILLHLFI